MEITDQYSKVREFITSLKQEGATYIECATLLRISTNQVHKILNKGALKTQRNYTSPVFRRLAWLEKEGNTLNEFKGYLDLKRKFNKKGEEWREV